MKPSACWRVERENSAWLQSALECRGFWRRLRGFLGPPPPRWEALWLPDATAVHTFFMKFSLDIYFLDGGHKILSVHADTPPGRGLSCSAAASVLEVPAGQTIVASRGETLSFKQCA